MSNPDSKYIMAIDQGTTSSRALIFNSFGRICSVAQEPFSQIFPKAGWVEHNPREIWQSVLKTMKLALDQAGIGGSQIAAIGITNQRETVLAWDRRDHEPVHNAIVWQCRRTTEYCRKISPQKKKVIIKKTGLVIDPYFSASKMNWLLKNVKGARELARHGKLAMGTVDAFLLWHLTGGVTFRTDVSNASRTQLMNIHDGDWDSELLNIFGVPDSVLPEIGASSGIMGMTKGLSFLPDGVPVAGVAGDQQAALFGQLGYSVGEGKITFGTGSFLLLNTGNKVIRSRHNLLSTVAWKLAHQKMVYALEGSVFVCGAAVQWLRDGLQFFKDSQEVESLASGVEDSGGVEFVPALTGLGAPYWRADARGVLTGLTRGTTRAHIARATLEAMALQNIDVIHAMEADLGKKIKMIRVDGGAVKNNLLMQIQSDFLGARVQRPQNVESTALGAAYLAGLGVGYWKDLAEIKKIWQLDHEFVPRLSAGQRRDRVERWHRAIGQSLAGC